MTTETQETLNAFINRLGLKLTVSRTDHNPHMDSDPQWSRSASHWRFTLRRDGRRMAGYFSQGSAHTKPPTLLEILDCLASDAAGLANADDFESWCADYGYDTDSRRAERTYKAVQRSAASLERVIGESDEYERLLFHTERL